MKEGGGIELISNVVTNMLKIPCAVLMGANIANEVASENYCEATIGKCFTPRSKKLHLSITSTICSIFNISFDHSLETVFKSRLDL